LKNKLKDIELAKSEILVVQKDRKECVEKRSVLIGKKGVLIGNTSQISESIKKYKEVLKVEGDAVVCPYCKSVKDRNHILKEINALVHTKNAIDTEITSISLEVFEKDKEESGYWSKEGAIQKVIGSEGPVWIEISKYETAEKNLAGIKERTKDLKHSYEVSKGADVTLLQEKLIKLEEASKSVDEKFESDEKKIRSDLTGLGESILSTQQEVLAIEKSVAKLNVVISNSHDSSKGWYGEYKTLELRLSSLRQFKANLVSAKKELENQRLIQTRISVLEDLFGSDGIRIKIADIYVPIFNRHLTDFVSILTAGRMHVQLQQGSLDPKITGASSSNYEMLSGGEQDVIRLAANLALGMVSLGSSRSLPETLFLDEVFGSLAPAMQDRVFDLLRHLRGYFSRILVITHNPMLQERFDRVVCVEKIGGISQITLGFVCE
jgi:DNA repair exonuclease SbcCD ATPase subunit